MTDRRAEYEASEYAQEKRVIRRNKLDRFLALKREHEQFQSIPKSKRRWDTRLSRWIEDKR
jgi:hypothetical protein